MDDRPTLARNAIVCIGNQLSTRTWYIIPSPSGSQEFEARCESPLTQLWVLPVQSSMSLNFPSCPYCLCFIVTCLLSTPYSAYHPQNLAPLPPTHLLVCGFSVARHISLHFHHCFCLHCHRHRYSHHLHHRCLPSISHLSCMLDLFYYLYFLGIPLDVLQTLLRL